MVDPPRRLVCRPFFLPAILLAGLAFGAGVTLPVEAQNPESRATTGRLEVRLTVDGAPGSGWRCALLDEAAAMVGLPERTPAAPEVAAGEADAEGLCALADVPPGVYLLRLSPPGDGVGGAERSARVAAGETRTVAFDLSAIPITGWVIRNDRPAPGHTVLLQWKGDRPTADVSTRVAQAVSDEDGEYEATVWLPGEYVLVVLDPAGRLVDQRPVAVDSGGAVVDFRLAGREVTGVVVDTEGLPAPGAAVVVTWAEEVEGGWSTATSSHGVEPDGRFSIPVETGPGTVTVNARGPGGRGSNVVELPLEEGESPEPFTLVLAHSNNVRGVLVDPSGRPVPGVLVMSFVLPSATGGDRPIGFDETDADGGFEVQVGEEPVVRLYATGPACALLRVDLSEPSADAIRLECPDDFGALWLRFRDPEGEPVAGVGVNLMLGGEPLPSSAIAVHLRDRGLAVGSDRSGELVIPALPPGNCEVWLPDGQRRVVSIPAGGVAELDVEIEPRR